MRAIIVTESVQVIAPAGNRDFMNIFNLSEDTDVFVCYDGDPSPLTLSNGFIISPGGQACMSNDSKLNFNHRKISVRTPIGTTAEIRVQGSEESPKVTYGGNVLSWSYQTRNPDSFLIEQSSDGSAPWTTVDSVAGAVRQFGVEPFTQPFARVTAIIGDCNLISEAIDID